MENLNQRYLMAFLLSFLLLSFTKPDETKINLVGTWQICRADLSPETKVGGKEGATRYLIIGENTFVVADVDLTGKTFVADFMGTYKMNKNIYTEHIKYSYPSLKSYLNKDYTFKLELKNGMLYKNGINNSFNEIWKRIEL